MLFRSILIMGAGTILMAYIRLVLRWKASLTLPNDPFPMVVLLRKVNSSMDEK